MAFYSVEATCRGCQGSQAFTRPILLEPKGVIPLTLTLLGEVRFIAKCLRRNFLGECRRNSRYFWSCQAWLSYDSVPGVTLKKTLCHTLLFGWAGNKYRKICKVPLAEAFYSVESAWCGCRGAQHSRHAANPPRA